MNDSYPSLPLPFGYKFFCLLRWPVRATPLHSEALLMVQSGTLLFLILGEVARQTIHIVSSYFKPDSSCYRALLGVASKVKDWCPLQDFSCPEPTVCPTPICNCTCPEVEKDISQVSQGFPVLLFATGLIAGITLGYYLFRKPAQIFIRDDGGRFEEGQGVFEDARTG